MISSILFLIISIHIIRKCSSSFDIASNYLTRGLGEGVKGPTINAIASSLPPRPIVLNNETEINVRALQIGTLK